MISLGNAPIPEGVHVVVPGSPTREPLGWKPLVGAAAVVVAIASLAAYALHTGSRTSTSTYGSVAVLPSFPTTSATLNPPPIPESVVQGQSNTLVEHVSESDSNRLGNAISVMLCMGHQTLAKRRDMSLTLAT